MVEECIHICANGQKCRRIPKRGQKFCNAHRAPRRRRRLLEEDHAFHQQIFDYLDHLEAMNLDDLLSETSDALASIHGLIDRRSSRCDRAAFTRATAAVGVTLDRLPTAMPASPSHPSAGQPAPDPALSSAPPKPSASQRHAQLAEVYETLRNAPQLPPDELEAISNRMLSILGPDINTNSTLNSYR
jgi:hypothetical protein